MNNTYIENRSRFGKYCFSKSESNAHASSGFMLILQCPIVGGIHIIMFMFNFLKEIKSNILLGILLLDRYTCRAPTYVQNDIGSAHQHNIPTNPEKVLLTTGAKPAFRTSNSLSPCAFTNKKVSEKKREIINRAKQYVPKHHLSIGILT